MNRSTQRTKTMKNLHKTPKSGDAPVLPGVDESIVASPDGSKVKEKADWERIEVEYRAGEEKLRKILSDIVAGLKESADIYERSKGMPIVDHEAAKKLSEERDKLLPLAAMHLLHGEQRACAMFDWMFSEKLLPEFFMSESGDSACVRELKFRNGKRVDRAVFHSSGTLLIIEIKDACDERSIVAGIGQALWYSSIAELENLNSNIVPVLVVLGEHDDNIARACARGNVEYFPLGSVSELNLLSRIAFQIGRFGD